MGVVQNDNDMEGTLEVGMGEFYTDLLVIFHVIVFSDEVNFGHVIFRFYKNVRIKHNGDLQWINSKFYV